MRPEENEIRQALAQRRFRPIERVWPEIRRELVAPGGARRRSAAAVWLALAVLVLAAAAVVVQNLKPANRRAPSAGFGVANVRSLGRPAESLVLQPDARTVMVIVR